MNASGEQVEIIFDRNFYIVLSLFGYHSHAMRYGHQPK